jgi:hypothetical protein
MSQRRKGFPVFEDYLEDDDDYEFCPDGWPPAGPVKGRFKKKRVQPPFCLKCSGTEKLVMCICEECLEKLGDRLLKKEKKTK